MRLLNSFIAGATVLLGGFLSVSKINFSIFLAGLSTIFITIGGNLINDFFDLPIDKINKPERPIPSGKIKKNEALLISIILFLFGNILLSFLGLKLLIVGFTATILLIIYTPFLKKLPLIGNIIIASLLSLTIIVGGVASSRPLGIKNAILPSLLIFLLNFPRELLKDGEDLIGDREAGLRTFPVVYGIRKTRLLAIFLLWVLFFSVLGSSFIFGKLFASCAIPGIAVPILIVIKKSSPTPLWFSAAQRILKILIFPGFISLFISKL
ncbi:MAG: geranylgeranylglycerol-phosphate geranylgeranyltransferase [candidate division WOR-3 bacterium]